MRAESLIISAGDLHMLRGHPGGLCGFVKVHHVSGSGQARPRTWAPVQLRVPDGRISPPVDLCCSQSYMDNSTLSFVFKSFSFFFWNPHLLRAASAKTRAGEGRLIEPAQIGRC